MIIPFFYSVGEAKRHIKRLHAAFHHYDVRKQAHGGAIEELRLQQVYSLVAQALGFRRWEDLRHALSCVHAPRYIDSMSKPDALIRILGERFSGLLGDANQTDTITAAIHFAGFGCSHAKYARAAHLAAPALASGMSARQLATVMWVEHHFNRGQRYPSKDYVALDYLRRLVIAKYLGRPLPQKPSGMKLSAEARIYEALLYRYLGMHSMASPKIGVA